eukprot:TRINITY_DN70388_c0_g1_i1.p1 TRINITY_DN70388_c0_g1~~TRINITY_DN70388_c0_g1_i1.p1  ORF type:complete len:610 (+),score=214.36 TRINITY_DN70388_c0_g1_i1:92-1831(+)
MRGSRGRPGPAAQGAGVPPGGSDLETPPRRTGGHRVTIEAPEPPAAAGGAEGAPPAQISPAARAGRPDGIAAILEAAASGGGAQRASPRSPARLGGGRRRESIFTQLRHAEVGADIVDLGAELSNRRVQRLALAACCGAAVAAALRRLGLQNGSAPYVLAAFAAGTCGVGAALRVLTRLGLRLLAHAVLRSGADAGGQVMEVLVGDLARLSSVYAYASLVITNACWRISTEPQGITSYDGSIAPLNKLPDPIRQLGGERLTELGQVAFLSIFSWRLTQISTRAVRALLPDKSSQATRPLEELLHTAGAFIGLLFVIARITGSGFQGMLRALGISGVALALGSQTVIQDLITFVSVVMDRPYLLGDVVSMCGVEGIVEGIGLKSTRIRGFDGLLHIIANKDAANARITNMSTHVVSGRSAFIPIELSPLTPPERLRMIPEVVARAGRTVGEAATNCAAEALVTGVGDTGIRLAVYIWSKTEPVLEFGAWREARHAMLIEVLESLKLEGFELASAAGQRLTAGAAVGAAAAAVANSSRRTSRAPSPPVGELSPQSHGDMRTGPTTPCVQWESEASLMDHPT